MWSNSCIVHRAAEVFIGRLICSQTSWVYRTVAGMVKYLYVTPARPIYLKDDRAYQPLGRTVQNNDNDDHDGLHPYD